MTGERMQGLSLSSLKKNPALIPLYVCTAVGMFGATFYVFRLATKSPEVTWSRVNNPEPWEEYRGGKQHKFYSPVRDYSKSASQAPNYKD